MQYADSVTKSFLTYGNPSTVTLPPGSMSDWQDPTYMGFQIRLVNSPNYEGDLNDLPHGLFTGNPKDNNYSTYNYLINRGEYKRAEYIRLFEEGFAALVNECPWYFVKVSGLADAASSAGINIGPKTEVDYGLVNDKTPKPWSAATFIKFSFEHCEIDITEAPTHLENVGIIADTLATNKITIIPGVIRESNTYGLLGAILDDTLVWQNYGKDAATAAKSVNLTTAKDTAAIPSSYEENPTRSTTQTAFNSANGTANSGSLLSQIGNKALVGAAAYANNAISNAVNGFLLGNAYGTSPASLLAGAQNILNNPAGAVERLLTRYSSPGLGASMAKKVELTGAEMNLVQSIIGQTTLEGAISDPNNPGNVSLVSADSPQAALGKQQLASPEISNTPPGKTVLSGVPSNNSELGNTAFDSPSINTTGASKVDLLGPELPLASPQKTNLSAFAIAGAAASKVSLRSPVKKAATPQNVSLEGATVINSDLGEADISGAPAETSQLGKADLSAALVPPTTLGKADL